jgi:hypothetical protein
VGWRTPLVDKYKLPTNHILVAYQNVEGHGHGLLDFYVPTWVWNRLSRAMLVYLHVVLYYGSGLECRIIHEIGLSQIM